MPFLAKWPARITPGTRYDAPVHHFDMYATAAAAGGGVLPDDRVVDGVDLVAHLADEIPESADPPHKYLFFRSGAAQAVRDERWKLMVSAPPDGEPQEWLFDLQTAAPERGNLKDDHPDIAARLRQTLDTHNAEQVESRWPWTITSPVSYTHLTLPTKA